MLRRVSCKSHAKQKLIHLQNQRRAAKEYCTSFYSDGKGLTQNQKHAGNEGRDKFR
jgi:hypothetical protein